MAGASVTRITISDTAAFDEVLKRAAEAAGGKGTLFLLFTGESDSAGVSWCPDCNDAKPVVNAVLAEAATAKGGVTLLEMPLIRADYRGNDAHAYRVHPQIKLQRIPTLMKWGARGKTGELVEEACRDEGLVRELLLE